MSWRGMEGGIDAAKQGHDVIMTPTSHAYFDYYQGDGEFEPLAIGGYTEVARLLLDRMSSSLEPCYEPARHEETRNSVADVSAAMSVLGYRPSATLQEKIDEVIAARTASP